MPSMSLPSQSQPIPIGYAKPGPFVVIRTCCGGDGDSGEYCTGMSQGGWWVNTNMYVFGFGFGTLDEEMHFLRPWNSFFTPNSSLQCAKLKGAKTYHISLKAAAIKYQYKYLHSHNHYHNVQMFYTAPIYIRTSSPNKDN
nr:hypothetical protein CFP56_63865 [Quercus suber]